MVPAKHDLTIYRDRDFSQVFYFKSHGAAMGLTGYSAAAQMRSAKDAEDLIVNFDVQIDEAIGKITVGLLHSQTIALMSSMGFWDLVLTDPDGSRQNYIEGSVEVLGTVTRGDEDPGGVEAG
jgi:hypothetical protein